MLLLSTLVRVNAQKSLFFFTFAGETENRRAILGARYQQASFENIEEKPWTVVIHVAASAHDLEAVRDLSYNL